MVVAQASAHDFRRRAHCVRDGIYKDLPLGRSWRRLVRACARPAEQGGTTRRLAEHALHADASREISTSFLRALNGLCTPSSATLPGIATPLSLSSAHDLGGCGSPLEQSVLSNAQCLERRGVHGQELTRQAVAGGLRTWRERQLRQIEQHSLSKAGRQAQPLLRAARQALQEADTDAMAQQIVSGSRNLPKARPPLNLDEDLTKPK
jgi:hypothetical protein